MGRVLYAILVGLVGAAIAHIVILFLIPQTTPADPWSRLGEAHDLYEVVPVSGSGPDVVPLIAKSDPLFHAAACRFDLEDGFLRLTSDQAVPFWSLSIHDRAGRTTYSLTDRAANGGMLDVAILTSVQMTEIRNAMPAGLDQAIFIESDPQGIVVVRVFSPDPSWDPITSAFLRDLNCEPFF